jgi:hypothetical protein
MAKKKYEFKPDKLGTGFLSKLYMTPTQRKKLLKWSLFALVLLVLSLLQDVFFCHMRLFGATTDLVPAAILLITILLGTESGCLFALIASCMYQFAGNAPGFHVIAILTVLGTIISMFRQNYLQRSYGAAMLCSGVAVVLYELSIFIASVLSGASNLSRIGSILVTAGLSIISLPILYPILCSIQQIGGDSWKE